MPLLEPDVPSEQWRLGESGRAAARALAGEMPPAAYLAASHEPKAVQTVQELAIGQHVVTDAGFREVERPHEWSGDYRARARAYVEGVCHPGWEPHADVIARFDDAVSRHGSRATALGQILVIGTHGMAPTVWLAERVTLRPSPAEFWERLRFPDVIDVDLPAGRAEQRMGVGTGWWRLAMGTGKARWRRRGATDGQ